jgi:hypothetical protein
MEGYYVEKKVEYVQAILAAIQFRMLHVSVYKKDIFLIIFVWVWNLVSCVKRRKQIEVL